MRHLNTILSSVLFSFSVIAGSACDVGGPGECHGLGGPFGPCDDHLAFLCLNDLECLVTESGRMCVPRPSHPEFDLQLADDCSTLVGGDMRCNVAKDRCVVSCAENPCTGGTHCDSATDLCVFPDTTGGYGCLKPGGLFGPCVDHECNDGLMCFSASAGEICVSSLASGEEWDTSVCAAKIGDLRCDDDAGFCGAYCDGDGSPSMCNSGTVCDAHTQVCVYPD